MKLIIIVGLCGTEALSHIYILLAKCKSHSAEIVPIHECLKLELIYIIMYNTHNYLYTRRRTCMQHLYMPVIILLGSCLTAIRKVRSHRAQFLWNILPNPLAGVQTIYTWKRIHGIIDSLHQP